MQITIPTLSYELNTMVRIHREEKGYTQEEFAFLIGRELTEIQQNEDLTSDSAYNINLTNFYARVLDKRPKDLFFENSIEDPTIKISSKKKRDKKGLIHFTVNMINIQKSEEIESYSILQEPKYDLSDTDFSSVYEILYNWLIDGYFKDGVTGFSLFQDLLKQNITGKIKLPESFRPILVKRALIKLSNKRKKPKLMPRRFLPKTPEKWVLYKEDTR